MVGIKSGRAITTAEYTYPMCMCARGRRGAGGRTGYYRDWWQITTEWHQRKEALEPAVVGGGGRQAPQETSNGSMARLWWRRVQAINCSVGKFSY